jgi:hypothetical protein
VFCKLFSSKVRSVAASPSSRLPRDPMGRRAGLGKHGGRAIGCAGIALCLACAHGIDLDLVPLGTGGTNAGFAGRPGNIGTEATSVTVGGANGGGGNGGGSAGRTGGSSGNGAGGASGSNAGSGSAAGGAAADGGTAGSLGGGGMSGSSGVGGQDASAGGASTDAGVDEPVVVPQPTAITLAPMMVSTGQLTSQTVTGTPFTGRCAANQVLIGFNGSVEPAGSATTWLRSFQAVCASLSITGPTYAVNTTQTTLLPRRGSQQAVAQMTMCPPNQVIVGVTAKSGGWIDSLKPSCAPISVTGMSPNYTLSFGPSTATPLYVGGPFGEFTMALPCPAGQIAVGDEGRASTGIEAFGLRCARPTLVIQ